MNLYRDIPVAEYVFRRMFDRACIVDLSNGECDEFSVDGALLSEGKKYDQWVLDLAVGMSRIDAADYFSRMDLRRILSYLNSHEKSYLFYCRLKDGQEWRDYQQDITYFGDDKKKLAIFTRKIPRDTVRPAGITAEVLHAQAICRFLVHNLVENFVEVNVRSGECRMTNGIERISGKRSFREQIDFWAEHSIVAEEREKFRRDFELSYFLRTLRDDGGFHTAIYTVQAGITRKTFKICSYLYSDKQVESEEYIFTYVKDITEQKEQEIRNQQLLEISEQLMSISQIENLTGLYNRQAGEKLIDQYLEISGRSAGAMMILDIDNFKQFNDLYGHQTGDFVLKYLSMALRDVFHPDDILCRWGGDEFMVFIHKMEEDTLMISVVERLQSRMAQCRRDTFSFAVTLSIGIAVAKPGEKRQELFERCDRALYFVKQHGRDGYRIDGRNTEQKEIK